MNKSLFTYITEFLAVLAIVINSIQFLLFFLAGIEYDVESGGGIVAIVNVAFCLYTVAWVILMEMNGPRPVRFEKWPYFLPVWIILSYFLENAITDGLGFGTFPGRQFIFFGTTGVPAIYLATYIYRHDRFDMITRNSDLIMLICTLALGLNLPNMLSSVVITIAGAGGHQEISYSAAFCFGINWVNIITGNIVDRLPIFQKKFWPYIFWALLPLQAIICVLGGGRGGGVFLLLCFVVTIFVFSRRNFGKTMLRVMVAIAIMAVFAIQSGKFADGFGRTFNYLQGGVFSLENDMSDIERTALRQLSYTIIGDSPVIGHGLWNGLKVAGYYMHNVFLDVLIAGGFVYFFIFLSLMKEVYKSADSMLRYDASKAMLLPWILYPTTMLLFSGFYLSNAYFWFFCIFCWLNRKNINTTN